MSRIITCARCGRPMEVPAFEGDGVYSEHYCESRSPVEEHDRRHHRDQGGPIFAVLDDIDAALADQQEPKG